MRNPALALLTAIVTLHSAASPAPCSAYCVCVDGYSTFDERVRARAAVFVGSVIDVHRYEKGRPDSYTFVVDRSWKGASADTVEVQNRGMVCEPLYQLGGTYLVLVDSIGRALIVPRCADPIWIHRAEKELSVLGPPKWRTPPVGQRRIDELVRQTIARQRDSVVHQAVRMTVHTGNWTRLSGIRVDLLGTGLSAVTDSVGGALFRRVALGWHVARLTFADGEWEDHYIRLRCRTETVFQRLSPNSCWVTEPQLIPRSPGVSE